MRIIISLLLSTLCLLSFAQRKTFKDPDLSWSFKKPKGWELFDDGLVAKVSPGVHDSATTYLTITYFESARAFGGMSAYGPEDSQTSSQTQSKKEKPEANLQRIGNYTLELETSSKACNQDTCTQKRYTFMHHGQRWEIVSSEPKKNQEASDKTFRKIIRSLRIEDN